MSGEFDELSGRIIAVAIEVHRSLGPGFLESVYENAMAVVLVRMGIRFGRQVPIDIRFEGVTVGKHVLDLMVDDTVVVELKAVKAFEDIHFATLRSYLRATGKTLGLLLNFNSPTLQIKRVVLGYEDR